MKLPASFAMILFVLFTACSSSGGKKVIVMSSGKMQLDEAGKTITFEPGNQHNDLEIKLSSDEKTITVKSPDGEKTYDVPDDGLYLLNLKSDTLIGNQVNYGQSGVPASITSEQLEHIIDSTQKLLLGQNASDESKTFFLVPNYIKKITANLNAQVLSPYQNIPYEVKMDKDGNAPEMYKFFTNNQKRESLEELLERLRR